MKEMYKSPELEVLCLSSVERIANSGDDKLVIGNPESYGNDSTVDIPLI